MHLFGRLLLFHHRENNRLARIVEGMNRDLLRIEHEDTQSGLRKLKEEMSEALRAGKQFYQEGQAALQELLEKVGRFEQSLYAAAGIPAESGERERIAYHAAREEEAVRLGTMRRYGEGNAILRASAGLRRRSNGPAFLAAACP